MHEISRPRAHRISHAPPWRAGTVTHIGVSLRVPGSSSRAALQPSPRQCEALMAHLLRHALRHARQPRPLVWATGAGAAGGAAWATAATAAEFVEVPPVFDAKHYPQGINANFVNDSDTDDVVKDHLVKFEDPEARDIARAFPELVELMKSNFTLTGATVCDVGAGTGLFTEPFVQSVGAAGEVVSVELSPHFVKHLNAKAKAAGYSNTKVVQ
jgi:hypothetical protein